TDPSVSASASASLAGDEQFLKLRTHRVPLGAHFFSPAGWSASVQATYIHQNGLFSDAISGHVGQDRFWVMDASAGYRFPKRYGRLLFQVKNLLNKTFNFQDTDPGNPVVKPQRLAILTF